MKKCHKCGREWVTQKRVKVPGVKETCEGCGAYLHSCKNCALYDPGFHNECKSRTTEWVADKEGANFCGEFEFTDREQQAAESGAKDSARSALDGLFGDSDEPGDDDRLDAFKNL